MLNGYRLYILLRMLSQLGTFSIVYVYPCCCVLQNVECTYVTEGVSSVTGVSRVGSLSVFSVLKECIVVLSADNLRDWEGVCVCGMQLVCGRIEMQLSCVLKQLLNGKKKVVSSACHIILGVEGPQLISTFPLLHN